MSYHIEFSPRADRQFRKLARDIQIALKPAIESLASNPYPSKIKKLEENVFRLRKGDFRVVYEVQEKALIVIMIKIGHRKGVYRK
jgi:mRNA interferase RelE/StbE